MAGFVLLAHARACQGSTQPGARDHMRLAVRRLTAAHYHRMRLPAGSTLLRIRALPMPVDKLHSGCRSPRAVRNGEEGFAGILRPGSKLVSAYYLTLLLVAACSCASPLASQGNEIECERYERPA